MRHRSVRSIAAFALVMCLTALPGMEVRACSCVDPGPMERIGGADILFTGVVIEEREPEQSDGISEAIYVFDVERSIDPIVTPFAVAAWWGGDANCGFDMNVGDRWVVFATIEDGVPRTNLCQGTAPMPIGDPELRRLIEARVTERAEPGEGGGAMDRQPGPIPGMGDVEEPAAPEFTAPEPAGPASGGGQLILIGAGLLVILGVSAIAFKRARPG